MTLGLRCIQRKHFLEFGHVLQVHKRDSAGDRSRECICAFAGGLQLTSAKVAEQRFVCLTADLRAVSGVYTLQRNSQLLERSV